MDTVQPLLNGVQPLLNGLNIETSGNPRRKHEKAHTAARFHCYHFRLIELVGLIVAIDTSLFLLYQTMLLFSNKNTTQMPIYASFIAI